MSFLALIEQELARRGVPERLRERIVAELGDHASSSPAGTTALGDPASLAQAFAAGLAADRARHRAYRVFGALGLTALALILGQLLMAPAGGYQGFDHGHSLLLAIPALLAMLVAPQVALVTGTLALIRAWRRRREHSLPDAEVALLRRRTRVAGRAGLVTAAGLVAYVADFTARLPAWWLWTQGALAAVAAAALLLALRGSRRDAQVIAGVGGPAGGLADDIPLLAWLAGRPRRLLGSALATALVATTLLGWHAEHSLTEGLERGLFEALVIAAAWPLLRRVVGLRPPGAEPRPVLGRR